MKKLLLAASLFSLVVLFYACNRNTGTTTNGEEVKMEEAKPKVETTKVVKEHGGPDQAKLDSLKAAKTKAKKKKSNN